LSLLLIEIPKLKGFTSLEWALYSFWVLSVPTACYFIITYKYKGVKSKKKDILFWTYLQLFNGLVHFFYAVIYTRDFRFSTLLFLVLLLLFLIISVDAITAMIVGFISLALYFLGAFIGIKVLLQNGNIYEHLFYTLCGLPLILFISALAKHFRKDRVQFITNQEIAYKAKVLEERLQIEESQFSKQKEFSQKILQAAEDERKWMAQEIHDELGQELAALKMNLFLAEPQGEEQNEIHNEMKAGIDRTVSKVRSLARKLRPIEIEEFGLAKSLENLLMRYDKHFEIKFDLIPSLEELSFQVKIELYRILQECLTNAFKYSKANKIWINTTLRKSRESILIEFGDNGVGLPQNQAIGIGFSGIQERVLLLDGAYAQESSPDNGLLHIIEIDFKNNQEIQE
jgi:signal transduction histidine kinase